VTSKLYKKRAKTNLPRRTPPSSRNGKTTKTRKVEKIWLNLKKDENTFQFKRAFKLFILLIIILPILSILIILIQNLKKSTYDDNKDDNVKTLNTTTTIENLNPSNIPVTKPVETNNTFGSYTFNNGSGKGYDEGYEWASDQDIDDSSYCDDSSSSFAEGCRDYVMEMAEEDPEGYSY